MAAKETGRMRLWISATRLRGTGPIAIATTGLDIPHLHQLRDPSAVIAHLGVFAQIARVQ